MGYNMNKLKDLVITKICDANVYCHECFRNNMSFEDVKETSFMSVKKFHNWAGKRFDSAWFMLTFNSVVKEDNLVDGVYLDFDGDAILYDDKGNILGCANNKKSREDTMGITRGAKFVPLDIDGIKNITLYVEVVNNAPHRPYSFPAFFKSCYYARYREDIASLYYECMARGKKVTAPILAKMKSVDKESVKCALTEITSIPIEGESLTLTNNLEYGHLKPLPLYARECKHEYAKVLNALDKHDDISYLASSAYDIFAVRDKGIRHRLGEYIKSHRIMVPANLTDFDISMLSGEMMIRGIKIGYEMLRDLYDIKSHIACLRSHTISKTVIDILKSAGIDTLYTDRVEDGSFEGVKVLSRENNTRLLNDYNVCMSERKAFTKKNSNVEYHDEIVKSHTEGAYTTMARLKLYNRQVEQALHNIEYIATYSYLLGNDYPHDKIDNLYRVALKYASFNALSGNNIKEVNDDLRAAYILLGKDIKALRDEITKTLEDKHNKKCVLNMSPYERNEWFKVGSDWYKSHAKPYSIEKVVRGEQPDDSVIKYTNNSIENDILRITFNKYGEIISILDKRDGSESIGGPSMRYYMFNDPKRKDNAINIVDKLHKGIKATFKFRKHKVFIDGATVIWQNQYRFRRNSVLENIVLTEGNDYIRIDNRVVWEDTNTMLRAEIVPSKEIDRFRTDTQLGTIERTPTSDRRHLGEFVYNKWIMAGTKDGLGITTDAKYGARVENKLISLNLLRSTRYPDNTTDICTHYFTICIAPNTDANRLNRLAYEMVSPITVEENIRALEPLIMSSNENIVVESIMCDKENNIIARIYDAVGNGGDSEITTSFNYDGIVETNVLEEDIKALDNNTVHLDSNTFKTLKFTNVRYKR